MCISYTILLKFLLNTNFFLFFWKNLMFTIPRHKHAAQILMDQAFFTVRILTQYVPERLTCVKKILLTG